MKTEKGEKERRFGFLRINRKNEVVSPTDTERGKALRKAPAESPQKQKQSHSVRVHSMKRSKVHGVAESLPWVQPRRQAGVKSEPGSAKTEKQKKKEIEEEKEEDIPNETI